MAAEAFALNVATNVVTELIKFLITITRTAVRCQDECRKLERELETIQPDVEAIELQLQELRRHDPTATLKMVDDWLQKLRDELHLASIKVHKSNTASRMGKLNVIGNSNLSKKITALNTKITKLAEQRVVLHLQLTSLLKGEQSMHGHQPPEEWRKFIDEKNAIVHREEFTRLSDRYMDASVHSGFGSSGHQVSAYPGSQLHRCHTTPGDYPGNYPGD